MGRRTKVGYSKRSHSKKTSKRLAIKKERLEALAKKRGQKRKKKKS